MIKEMSFPSVFVPLVPHCLKEMCSVSKGFSASLLMWQSEGYAIRFPGYRWIKPLLSSFLLGQLTSKTAYTLLYKSITVSL